MPPSLPVVGALRPRLASKHPIVVALGHAGRFVRWYRPRRQVTIVSRELCDDILKQIGPSLDRHKGCDIVDINPGNGMWSTALHEYLKPREHILMSQQDSFLDPDLKTLAESEDSSFRLAEVTSGVFQLYDTLGSDGFLSHRDPLRREDPRIHEPEDTLLLTGILGDNPKERLSNMYRKPSYILMRLLSSLQPHDLLQRYGSIRMLLWISDDEKFRVLPRTVADRRKYSAMTDLLWDVTEVAGLDGPGATPRRREQNLEFENCLRIAKLQTKAGTLPPPHRRREVQRRILEDGEETLEETDKLSREVGPAERRAWGLEYKQLLEDFHANKFAEYVGQEPGKPAPRRRSKQGEHNTREKTPEFARLTRLKALARWYNAREKELEKIILQRDAIRAFDAEIRKLDPAEQAHMEKSAERKVLLDEYEMARAKLIPRKLSRLRHLLDDRKALEFSPPVLQWDRRTTEPLVVQPSEFSPARPLALMDFRPRTPLPEVLRDDAAWMYLVRVMSFVYTNPREDLVVLLEKLLPGARDAVVPRAMRLLGPADHYDLAVDHLSSRATPAHVWLCLAEALEEWALKPSLAEVVTLLGGKLSDPLAEGGTAIGKR